MFEIGIGTKTSTGGSVIEGNSGILFNGLVASSIGHSATCPACKKGIGKIVAVGSRTIDLPAGPAARVGDYVACGCPPMSNVLLATSSTITIGALCGSSKVDIVESIATSSYDRKVVVKNESGQPIVNCQYKIELEDGKVVEGYTNEFGEVNLIQTDDISKAINIYVKE
ncbi:PAAR domain-containing protein [Photobacterium damselae]|uniref:PAAR domain-containing protein n=1 Tax=Photobacterium damselae TaxID=38293 RepID=UPI003D7F153D